MGEMYFKPDLVIFQIYHQDRDFLMKENVNRYIVTGTNWTMSRNIKRRFTSIHKVCFLLELLGHYITLNK